MPPNLTVSVPRCRHCNRQWRPPYGVMATHEYCGRCSKRRRAAASEHFEARALIGDELLGGYLLPRRLRSAWAEK